MTAIETDEEFMAGTCRWCGCDGPIYPDTKYCEGCDVDIMHCLICDEDHHVDDLCRHIRWSEYGEHFGAGIGAPPDYVRTSFLALIDAMPPGFAIALREAIQSGRFHTWQVAPMIGGGGLLYLRGMSDELSWGDHLLRIGESDDADSLCDGYGWLVSLWNDATPAANATTIDWLNERRETARAGRSEWFGMGIG